jgi:cystathionine beta-lyase/cystathionine gamma-synthase
MTPANSLAAIERLIGAAPAPRAQNAAANRASVLASIREVTGTKAPALVGSSGLSVQYAVVMGLVHHAIEHHHGKPIRIVVPTNCYGGTNDQARRVAACREDIEVVDLEVDGGRDMVQSLDAVLEELAAEDAVPLIIAEIPTNPRVEVPDLGKLRDALGKDRRTSAGGKAVEPIFILDQTFCPNVRFLGEGDVLCSVQTIAYVSGSKFPSGGRCTAGYCVANARGEHLLEKIERHMQLCDNEATEHQLEVLAGQLPSMLDRIAAAYANTREFVSFVRDTLPSAKINFVSDELAKHGFTPSVFSLDLPTQGNTDEEREAYKRASNLALIRLMIGKIPGESKFCVSYGQLKGCYWTVPATSTQGTTKEGHKDYIVRVALSPELDLARHKAVFQEFVNQA